MFPIIKILNDKGYSTTNCCSGHAYDECCHPYIAFHEYLRQDIFEEGELEELFLDLPNGWELEVSDDKWSFCLRNYIPHKDTIEMYEDTVKPSYRLCTRVLDELLPIRNMSRSEIISQLNEFGLAIHFLDDASRNKTSWEMCYAAFTNEEKELYCGILKERFDIEPHIHKDTRYIGFNKADSQKIDEIILRNIPDNLDIIRYKILDKM